MTKTLRILESQYKKLIREFDENDDENSVESHEKKVKWLLASGDEQNIELAFMFMDSLNLDKKALLRPYQETFEFLKKYRELYDDSLDLHAFVRMVNKKALFLIKKNITTVPALNLPYLTYLDLKDNNLLFVPNIQYLPNLTTLDLRRTKIAKEIYDFSLLLQLERLYLGGNGFTNDELLQIGKMLPTTYVMD